MLYLGIDQHHKQLTISLRNGEGNVILKRQVSTRPEKTRAFLDDVRSRSGDDGFMAVLEVCGFNDWLIELLGEVGCREVVLIHPGKRSRRKTDRRDASKLSELLWLNGERLRNGQQPQGLRRVVIPSPDDQADRQLTALRKRVGQQRTRSINKIKNILRRHNLTWDQPTKTFQTRMVRKWLSELDLPEMDRLEMDQLLAQWTLWERQLEQLEKRIKQRYEKNASAKILATAPGGGAYSTLAIASRIGSIERFASPRSLANYFGLTPSCRNSGEATDRLGSITKEGSGMVRFITGQMVLHALKRDPHMREWYRRIRRRRGSKIARVAVMRRLVTIFWHMLTHQEGYCIGGPPRLRFQQAHRKRKQKSAGVL
ncbi:MAG: IS110 family transposase [Planctomycetes bacterium]|nr:IS110 family transposase [Planctomycetota bacterium]